MAKRAYMQYLTENALDPTVYPSLARMERELISMAASMLGGDQEVVGNFTSGGTESCLLAVKTARDWARATKKIARTRNRSAGHRARRVPQGRRLFRVEEGAGAGRSGQTFRAIPSEIEKAITPNTALIVASAVSYAHGVVDPVAEIAPIALKHDVLFHVDNCIGGFILQYFRKLAEPVPDFDFSVPGVTSISMDWHKYGYCPKGAAVILYKNKALRRFQIFATADWTGYTIINPTIQSAKSGGPVAAAWAVVNFLGDDGYLRFARRTLAATKKIKEGIEAIPGLRILGTPDANLLAFTADDFSIFHVIDEMKRSAGTSSRNSAITARRKTSISPSAKARSKRPMLSCSTCARPPNARASCPMRPLVDLVKAELAKMGSGEPPIPPSLQMLMEALGVTGGKLPERMADLNQVLNVLPPQITQYRAQGLLQRPDRPAAVGRLRLP